MSETVKDIMKLIAEIGLLLFLLYVLFGGNGIAKLTMDFSEIAEPLTIQNEISRTVTIASYTPGEYTRAIYTNGKEHTIEITQDEYAYYVNIFPDKEGVVKTEYKNLKKIPMFSDCIIEPLSPLNIQLQEDATRITITKTMEEDGCKIVIS
ncbi:MAG: hypothetical protein PHU12_02950 [Candidatus Aenigmarchaeota archaeon]|nr:hypothetical protein [Candidatus Aenigmarchaeota archaeon]